MKTIAKPTWRVMKRGEKLPKHYRKDFNHMSAEYEYYYLMDNSETVIAEYKKPRVRGLARMLRGIDNV